MAKAEELARTFLTYLQRGDFSGAHQLFAPSMKLACPLVFLEDLWRRAEARIGNLRRYDKIEVLPNAMYEVILVDCEFARGTYGCRLAFQDEQIVSLYMDDRIFAV